MSTFHPATSLLANFKNTISTISTTRFFVYISCSHQDKNLRLSWHHSSSSFYLPTTLLICCQVSTVLPTRASRFWRCGQFFPLLLSAYCCMIPYKLKAFQCQQGYIWQCQYMAYGTATVYLAKPRNLNCN